MTHSKKRLAYIYTFRESRQISTLCSNLNDELLRCASVLSKYADPQQSLNVIDSAVNSACFNRCLQVLDSSEVAWPPFLAPTGWLVASLSLVLVLPGVRLVSPPGFYARFLYEELWIRIHASHPRDP